jgi:hypothetical protein
VLFNSVAPDAAVVNGASSEFYFGIGNAVDDVLGKAWRKAGILMGQEVNVPDIGINLGGRIDAVIKLDGQPTIIEHKTCGNNLPRAPKLEHEAQCMIYAAITGLPAHVLYVSRNPADWQGNLNIVSFTLDTSIERRRYYLTQAVTGYIYTKSKRTPPISPMIESKSHCGFCPFQQNCWETNQFYWPLLEDSRVKKANEMIAAKTEAILAATDARREAFIKKMTTLEE